MCSCEGINAADEGTSFRVCRVMARTLCCSAVRVRNEYVDRELSFGLLPALTGAAAQNRPELSSFVAAAPSVTAAAAAL